MGRRYKFVSATILVNKVEYNISAFQNSLDARIIHSRLC